MSKAQLVITAVVLEGRSKSEVARDYGMSRYWVQRLVKRYEAEGPCGVSSPIAPTPPTTATPSTQQLKTPSFDCAKP